MAITEDSRIPVLSEVLAAELATLYSTLELFIDDPSYPEAKRIKVETLLETINQSITSINLSLNSKAFKTDVLEKNNTTAYTPSADYHPVTVKYFKEHSEALSFDLSGIWSGFTIITISGKRSGNRFSISCRILSVNSTTTSRLVGRINNYVSPGYVHRFSSVCYDVGVYQSANGYIDTNGDIYLKTGASNKEFVFDTCIIS